MTEMPKICFVLGMMPRTGTNWVYNLLMQSDHVGDIGPIWEDNLLNHIAILEGAAQKIVSSWNPDWKAHHQKLEVKQLTESLQINLEFGIEKFILQQFRESSCKKDDPAYLVLKSPNAWQVIPPKMLLKRNKCIILIRNPHDLIASGISSFGWRLFGACNRYIQAAETIIHLNSESTQCLIISFEDLRDNLDQSVQRLYDQLELPVPSVDFLSLKVSGKSPERKNEKVSWSAKSITSKEQIQKQTSKGMRLSKLQHTVVSEICGPAGNSLGYTSDADKTPNVVRWSIRFAFHSFCFLKKLKG